MAVILECYFRFHFWPFRHHHINFHPNLLCLVELWRHSIVKIAVLYYARFRVMVAHAPTGLSLVLKFRLIGILLGDQISTRYLNSLPEILLLPVRFLKTNSCHIGILLSISLLTFLSSSYQISFEWIGHPYAFGQKYFRRTSTTAEIIFK